MGLFEKKQEPGRGEKGEKIPPSKEKKDTSGFKGKPYLSREELRRWLRGPEAWKASGLAETERVKLEKELSESKYGYYIERGEPERAIKELEKEKYKAKTGAEKVKIDKKINLLKKFSGK